jgi:predicted metalloprotease with PDZ domain
MSSPAVHYSVDAADVQAHLYRVTLTIAKPAKNQRLSLPVWIPGSYMVREFSKHLQQLVATQGGKTVALQQLDKCTWQAANSTGKPLVLRYAVYAYDNSVRTAWLDAQRGFFNATSLCLRVEGQTHKVHQLELIAIKKIAACAVSTGSTALKVDKKGFGTYVFEDYDALADTPFELGAFWRGKFSVRGVPHELVVAGAPPSFDSARLLADTQKVVETEMQFWHGDKAKPPFERYVFMLNVVDDGYGGLEHRNSTALICSRRDLPRQGVAKPTEGYTTLLGLISHEYFHTWNVKRLRPVDFAHYHYSGEQYTQLLWFFEGFTSYYDDLLLRRAGLIDNAQYLKLLNKTINQVQQTPGAQVQSVAQSSFDAWVKYYRQDENTPNATVSYYTKGALVALCFDLTLRAEGKTTLDAVMRALWQRCKAGPMAEADFAAVLQDLGGRSFAKEIAAWVHGTGDLPLKALLEQHGVHALDDQAQMAQRLGLRVTEANGSLQVKVVLRGSAAEQAGLCAGDEWLAVGTPQGGQWRLHKLDDLPLYLPLYLPAQTATNPNEALSKKARKLPTASVKMSQVSQVSQVHLPQQQPQTVQVLVSRDKRLHTLPLQVPGSVTTWLMRAADTAKVDAWLVG